MVREAVWGRRQFLGEEGREEDRGVKRGGCSPWRMADIVGIAVLADTEAGTVALDDIAALASTAALAGTVAGIALVEES